MVPEQLWDRVGAGWSKVGAALEQGWSRVGEGLEQGLEQGWINVGARWEQAWSRVGAGLEQGCVFVEKATGDPPKGRVGPGFAPFLLKSSPESNTDKGHAGPGVVSH